VEYDREMHAKLKMLMEKHVSKQLLKFDSKET
jgi:hypothetical protein